MSGGSGNQLLDTGLMIAAGVAAPELALAIAPEMMGAGAVSAGLATGLSGAALSGGVAAATGQDVGKAALMGGIGGGLGGYLQGANAAAAGTGATTGTAGAPVEFSQAESLASPGINQAISPANTPFEYLPNGEMTVSQSIPTTTADQAVSNLGQNSAYAQTAPAQGIDASSAWNQAGSGKGMWSSLSPMNKAQAIGAGVLGANALLSPPNIQLPQSTAPNVPKGLQFHFNEDPNAMYQPSFAPNYNGIAGINTGMMAQRPIGYADGGTVEQMSRENAIGGNQMFPQSGIGGLTGANTYQNATNTPIGTNVLEPTDAITDPYTGAMKFASGGISPTMSTQGTQQNSTMNIPMVKQYLEMAQSPIGMKKVNILAQQGDYNAQFAINHLQGNNVQGIDADSQVQSAAKGGIMGYSRGSDLGSYSDGGQLLKGPGTGISDDIPAKIGHHQPARLAEGEFVVPARIVSELGKGSTEAGAKELYKMMDRVQNSRKKTIGKGKFAKDSYAEKALPA